MSSDRISQDSPDFSLVPGGPLFQLLRRAHLTDDPLELQRRRIVVIALIAWLPLLQTMMPLEELLRKLVGIVF